MTVNAIDELQTIDQTLIDLEDANGTPSVNPARVYLAGLRSRGSEPTQRRALIVIARLLAGLPIDEDRRHLSREDKAAARSADDALIDSVPWSRIRYHHVAALTSTLAATFAPATSNRIIAALKGVLKESWRLGQMSADDYQRAVDLKAIESERLPAGRDIQSGELAALLDTCEPTRAGIRDAAIISVLYVCGLRRAELVALDVVDYIDGVLTIRKAKRNKQRQVHITNGARAQLEDWLNIRGDATGALFTGLGNRQSGDRLTTQAIYNMLQTRHKLAGLSAPLSPHDFRRTCAGDLLDAGVDIATVARILGHSDIRQTAKYDRRKEAVKRDAAARLHVPYRKRTLLD